MRSLVTVFAIILVCTARPGEIWHLKTAGKSQWGKMNVATFENPNQLSAGIQYLLVNGVPVIANGKATNALPGKVLRGPGYQP